MDEFTTELYIYRYYALCVMCGKVFKTIAIKSNDEEFAEEKSRWVTSQGYPIGIQCLGGQQPLRTFLKLCPTCLSRAKKDIEFDQAVQQQRNLIDQSGETESRSLASVGSSPGRRENVPSRISSIGRRA